MHHYIYLSARERDRIAEMHAGHESASRIAEADRQEQVDGEQGTRAQRPARMLRHLHRPGARCGETPHAQGAQEAL